MDNGASESDESSEESIAGDVTAPCSGAHTLGLSRFNLRRKRKVSKHKKRVGKVKLVGVYGVRKHPKIKVNRKMDDESLLDIILQVTVFKKNDCVEKNVSKGKHCISFSGEGESCSKL